MGPSFALGHWARRSSAWLCGVALLVGLRPVLGNANASYPHAQVVDATLILGIAGAATAAATAWEMSRFRVFVAEHPRALGRIGMDRILPFSLVVPAGYAAAVLVISPGVVVLADPILWLLFGYSACLGVCWALAGAACGLTLRPVVAIPLAGVIPFLWQVVIPAQNPSVLTRLAGDFLLCCAVHVRLDPRAVVVAALGVLAVCSVVVGTAALRHRAGVFGGAALLLAAVCTLGGTSLARTMDVGGLVARNTAEMICRGNVCAWPETPTAVLELNNAALREFRRIAPPQWQALAAGPVRDDGFTQGTLSLSGQATVEGVLVSFVDQAVLLDLIRNRELLCGQPAADFGVFDTGASWPAGQAIDTDMIRQRLQEARCPAIPAR